MPTTFTAFYRLWPFQPPQPLGAFQIVAYKFLSYYWNNALAYSRYKINKHKTINHLNQPTTSVVGQHGAGFAEPIYRFLCLRFIC